MIEPSRARRILIVALDNLGDLVFASALTPPLRRALPDATIDVWSKAYTARVAELLPHVSHVVAADPFWAVPRHLGKPPVLPFLRSIAEVRRRRYDVALVTGAPWRTAAVVAAAGIPVRVGLGRHQNEYFLTHALPAEDPGRPVLAEQARLLGALGIDSPAPRYELDASRLGEIGRIVAAQLPPRFVAVHPFASVRDRCVPLNEWAALALALHARGTPVVWIGMPAELAELRTLTLPWGIHVDQLADGSMSATAAALSRASMFIGHDSGPLHVAAAFGVPVVGVYAPGEPQRTFPQGVGPMRMIARPSPEGITAAMILREMEALEIVSVA